MTYIKAKVIGEDPPMNQYATFFCLPDSLYVKKDPMAVCIGVLSRSQGHRGLWPAATDGECAGDEVMMT